MAKRNNLNLKKELDEKNIEFHMKDTFLGKDVLTLANKINSSRNIMFNSHIEQAVVLANPEFPRVFTNYENEVGKYSSSYKKVDKKLTVVKKISKFSSNPNYRYILVVKDENNCYDVIERKIGEKLTEGYCYLYNNESIDNKVEGEKINKDEVLYRSTSFDSDMNYRFGVNAKAVYLIENNTIEDAILVSDKFAERLDSYYMDEVQININTNDILCNLYSTDRNQYKAFPDIGEKTKKEVLTSRRRINYENALYDLQSENLSKINYNTDTIFYSNGTVVDIDIYSNQDLEELKKYFYNEQLIKYLEMQKEYNEQIVEVLGEIIKNKKVKYTNDLSFMYRRAKDALNPDTRWSEKTDFDNVMITFQVLNTKHLHVGSKLVARYGNKGVVSKIIPQEEMPMTEHGEYADLVFNSLGVTNRLNPAY